MSTELPVPPSKDNSRCECPGEEHTCPYAEEINGDFETTCTCCNECTRDCADDI